MPNALFACQGKTDLDYFVHWRPYLWLRPVRNVLKHFGDLSGKNLLEIGGGPGRMTALFALKGANVTMIDTVELDRAQAEIDKWDVRDRVRLVRTDGSFEALGEQKFDFIFTKSVLWSVEDLSGFLAQVEPLLAKGGKVAFVENFHGGKFWLFVRKKLFWRGQRHYDNMYHGIRPEQLPIFGMHFDKVQIKRHRYFVYQIMGHKKPAEA